MVAGPTPPDVAPDVPPAPSPSADPPEAWTPEAMQAAAARALARRVIDERARLAAGVTAAPASRRADVQRRVDAALARIEALERRVTSAGADPIEAYTGVEQVKRALLDEVRGDLGADAAAVIAALGPPDTDDAGWGIPVDEVGAEDEAP